MPANVRTSEAGGTAKFQVVLTAEPTGEVTVPIGTSDPTEGAASTSLLTFTPTDWDVPQEVTVTGVDDTIDDGDAPYAIRLGTANADVSP